MPCRARLSVLLILGALAGGVGPARAEEAPPSPAQALCAEIETAKTAKDEAAWSAALRRIGGLYADAPEADRKALAAVAGQGLKAKSESVQGAALEALVGTKDGEAAWKAGLKGLLPDPKADEAEPFELRCLAALKDLHPEGAVAPLLGLLQKAKDPKVCAGALEALSGYERSKQRVTILDEVVKVVRTARPGQSTTKQTSASPKWTEMEGKVVPALNALTGQSVADLATWLQMVEEHKKKLGDLFQKPLGD